MEYFADTKRNFPVLRNTQHGREQGTDWLAVEEPLEIRLGFGPAGQRVQQTLAVTMRTPGHDFDLVTGFLLTEGIIGRKADILQMRFLVADGAQIVLAELRPSLQVDLERLGRHFYAGSSCGICGKTSLDAVHCHPAFLLSPGVPVVRPAVLAGLAAALRPAQSLFADTGGSHAAALFDADGHLLCAREDIGRHNALDKLVGTMLKNTGLPLSQAICLVSGRAGFEIVQKALMAGIPILVSVGAPSSMAVELAESGQMTLVGFLRNEVFNVYTGNDRITAA